ncbi:PREDICTED: LOW QUALITY PROTEIN: toll-like receptor 1 [Myotis davidii]|uniref:LOW QUALITY PROTEIN: toll-like receptor 1 n=1 Tax=Myotis davidii TaxID=225400 RepID=UPI00076741AB|nr:PREDICTED: LOW QUALITY PROTEIN: toll-like receptor 1 [Myotis davidii]
MTKTNSTIFHFVIIFMLILEIKIQLSEESEFLVDRSKGGLTHVPKDLSLETTILDLSQNDISELQASDILLLSKLRVLRISHNRIQYLDMSVFKFNQELEYLDLSHNELEKISCHSTVNLKHLDLSFNAFDALPICKEFGNMSQLEFLGLSATQLQKSSVLPIAHLHINKVLLVLGDHYGENEDPESLQDLNTESLHVVFPAGKESHFALDVSVSTAVSLELSNIKCVLDDNGYSYVLSVLSKLQNNSRISNLTLNNIETTWHSFITMFQLVWHTSIEYFSISNVKLQGRLQVRDFDYSDTSLKALSIHQVVSEMFSLPQSYIYKIFSNMNIQNFTVSGTHMVHMVCPSQMSPFLHLDFSNNLLTDMVFNNCGTLTRLETLSLQMNQLKKLANIVHMTKEMKSLQQLDISQNSLSYDENEEYCSWTISLLSLNMSSNILTDSVFRCLPPRLRVLDLHSNRKTSIPENVIRLEALQELNLASNSLAHLPGCDSFSSLSVLIIDFNSISNPSAHFFQSCQKIRSINAGNNPFQCTCDLFQGTQTRHRARNTSLHELQRTLQFHAFISYSEHDSAWVKNELLPNLEKEDIRICLHERNFVPGKSIVENIINCIEKSYKSIFVLSPNFVQSEWCHYELYFAHHNLFHEGSNNLILILLESIPMYSIPSSYHKLKTLMAQRTYLEWPKEKSKHGLFWANLRASIRIKLMYQAKETDHTYI